jgi:hypothetical protein
VQNKCEVSLGFLGNSRIEFLCILSRDLCVVVLRFYSIKSFPDIKSIGIRKKLHLLFL